MFIQNLKDENTSLIGIKGTPWHAHEEIQFSRFRNFVEYDYSNIIKGLANETILISSLFKKNKLQDRYLIHKKFNTEIEDLQKDEEIKVTTVATII